jgi:hypothetical protein
MIVLLAETTTPPDGFLYQHSGELIILVVIGLVLLTLLILAPQLLRAHQRSQEMLHAERMKALEAGHAVPRPDPRSVAAGRTAALVPMVVMCSAATVTSFLAAYRSEGLFSIALAVWTVGGVVSLAAITVGGALMGRLAQLQQDEDEASGASPNEK